MHSTLFWICIKLNGIVYEKILFVHCSLHRTTRVRQSTVDSFKLNLLWNEHLAVNWWECYFFYLVRGGKNKVCVELQMMIRYVYMHFWFAWFVFVYKICVSITVVMREFHHEITAYYWPNKTQKHRSGLRIWPQWLRLPEWWWWWQELLPMNSTNSCPDSRTTCLVFHWKGIVERWITLKNMKILNWNNPICTHIYRYTFAGHLASLRQLLPHMSTPNRSTVGCNHHCGNKAFLESHPGSIHRSKCYLGQLERLVLYDFALIVHRCEL